MTFNEIKTAIKDQCNLTSTEADTRVGKSINRHYKRVTASLGLDTTRFVTRTVSATIGLQTVTFTGIEKIDRIIDATDSTAIVELTPVSLDTLRSEQPGTGSPTRFAIQSVTATSITILLDTIPQAAYSLQADGRATVSDLSGTDVPAIAESYHDILTFLVLAEELLKKEKTQLAREYASGDENKPGRAEKLLQAYRFELADAPPVSFQQGSAASAGAGAASGGGNTGASAYTQTGLITFDRDPSAPFAVTDTSAYVANLYVEGVGNVTTDRLIGRDTTGTGESEQLSVGGGIEFTGSGGIQTSAFTGDVTKAAGGTATTIANDAVTFAKMQDIASDRLIGRDTASAGNPEEISVTNGLEFTGGAAIGIANDGVTYARMQNVSAASRVLGRGSANGAGDPEELSVTNGLEFTGGAAIGIANDGVTYARMQNVSAASRVLGRGSANGAGDPEELSLGSGLSLSGTTLSATATNTCALLHESSGSSTTTSANDLATYALASGLTAKDTLLVLVNFNAVTQGANAPVIVNGTDTVDLADLGSLTAGQARMAIMYIRQSASGATAVHAATHKIKSDDTTSVDFEQATFTTNYTGNWSIKLRSAGVTSGGTLHWRWTIYKMAGQ